VRWLDLLLLSLKDEIMVNISKGPHGETLRSVVIVAFDRTSGLVHGTFVHGSLDAVDQAGIARSRERLIAAVIDHPGRDRARIDTVEVPLDEVPPGAIERVDPVMRKVMMKPHELPPGLHEV
jgi:hypothetical protein